MCLSPKNYCFVQKRKKRLVNTTKIKIINSSSIAVHLFYWIILIVEPFTKIIMISSL